MTVKPLIVSFHTGQEPYTSYARSLADSCAAFELDCLIQELPDQGTWIENVALKGPFMRRCMRRFDQPLLWIDVDGRIVAEPKLLYGMDADFAIYAVKREWNWKPVGRERMSLPEAWPRELGPRWFLTGTMLVNRTAAAKDLLERWAETSMARPRDYQQLLLQEVWCMLPALRTMWLPQGYCKISGFRWHDGEPMMTVIAHDLASSQLESCVRA
jgi:hypothetical protein